MRLAGLLAPIAMSLAMMAADPAAASQLTAYRFNGTCTDCSGTATGELVLADYVRGTDITSSNFVSFHYDGTNLIPGGFTLTNENTNDVGGSISDPLPGAEYVSLYGSSINFFASGDGSWQVGYGLVALDYGTAGTYSLIETATAVPEPASLTLLGVSIAGIAATRRRRAA